MPPIDSHIWEECKRDYTIYWGKTRYNAKLRWYKLTGRKSADVNDLVQPRQGRDSAYGGPQ